MQLGAGVRRPYSRRTETTDVAEIREIVVMKLTMIAGAVTAAALMAGGAAVAQASTGTAAGHATSCVVWAREHTFVQIDKAKAAPRG